MSNDDPYRSWRLTVFVLVIALAAAGLLAGAGLLVALIVGAFPHITG